MLTEDQTYRIMDLFEAGSDCGYEVTIIRPTAESEMLFKVQGRYGYDHLVCVAKTTEEVLNYMYNIGGLLP